MDAIHHLSRRSFLACAAPLFAAPKLAIRSITTRKYTIGYRDYLFVEIETSTGIRGIGEASISGRVDIVEQAVHWFIPHLTGKEPSGIEDHWNRNYYTLSRYRNGPVLMTALAGIDIALWDIRQAVRGARLAAARISRTEADARLLQPLEP